MLNATHIPSFVIIRSLTVQPGGDIWPNLRKLFYVLIAVGNVATWKERKTGVQQLIMLLFDENLYIQDLPFDYDNSKKLIPIKETYHESLMRDYPYRKI